VRILIRAKGLAIEILPPPGGSGSNEFRRIAPIGKIPALDTGGGLIVESEVIQEYLEDRYPRPPMRGGTPEEAARVRLLGRLVDLYLIPALGPLRSLSGSQERERAAIETAMTGLREPLGHLGHYLDPRGPFAAGPVISLADCALAPAIWYADRFATVLGVASPVDDFPRLRAWRTRAFAEPAIAGVLGELASAGEH
jgi:glutathione S-transferase